MKKPTGSGNIESRCDSTAGGRGDTCLASARPEGAAQGEKKLPRLEQIVIYLSIYLSIYQSTDQLQFLTYYRAVRGCARST